MATVNLGRVVGYSAYEIAVQNGYVGTEEQWLASLKGRDGIDGTISFEELTPEQKASLKGDIGPEGPKGEAFTYEDFTPEQLEALRGPKGDTGEVGPQGPVGPKGEDAILPSFKTINGETIIGEGDITIQGGGADADNKTIIVNGEGKLSTAIGGSKVKTKDEEVLLSNDGPITSRASNNTAIDLFDDWYDRNTYINKPLLLDFDIVNNTTSANRHFRLAFTYTAINTDTPVIFMEGTKEE